MKVECRRTSPAPRISHGIAGNQLALSVITDFGSIIERRVASVKFTNCLGANTRTGFFRCVGIDFSNKKVYATRPKVEEVVEGVKDSLTENRVWVEDEEAVFDQVRPLRFRNRFGGLTVRARRCYKYLEHGERRGSAKR